MPEEEKKSKPLLEGLKQELYSRQGSETVQGRAEELDTLNLERTPVVSDEDDRVGEPKSLNFKDMAGERASRRRKIIRITIIAVILLAALVGAAFAAQWYRARQTVTDDQVRINIVAPESLTAGDEITYQVTYANDSFVDWENVEFLFEAPAGFTVTEEPAGATASGQQYSIAVGTLEAGAEERFTITGVLIGEEQASLVAQADLVLTPKNFPSGRFTHTELFTSTIAAVPLDVAIVAPQEVVAGERTVATFTVTNTSAQTLTDISLNLQPDVGVSLTTDDPQFTPDFVPEADGWTIPSLAPLESAERTAIFSVQGQVGEQRTIGATVRISHGDMSFVQRRASAIVTVSSSEIQIRQTYDGEASPSVVRTGQEVQGVVTYANAGSVGIKDMIVRTTIEGEAFDPASLELPAGAYDTATRTITWTPASVPELALVQPGSEGDVEFTFTIREASELEADEENINSALILTSVVDVTDPQQTGGQEAALVSDRYVLSVATDVTLEADAFYDDGRLGLTSTGPVPPKVGEQTTYTVRTRLGSTLNSVGDMRVVMNLHEGVQFTQEHVVTTGDVTFNERSGEVVWAIPQVPAMTGRTSPAAEMNMQVAITPAENQRGQSIDLVRDITATGTDLFTDIEVTQSAKPLPTTDTASPGKGDVE